MLSTKENVSTQKNVIQPRLLATVSGLALFFVIFIWNFFERGIYALGINATVFLLLALMLFLQPLRAARKLTARDLVWIIPFVLIAISYSLYDNPFWKITSILIVPASFAVFYLQSFTSSFTRWTLSFFLNIAFRFLSIFKNFGVVSGGYMNLVAPKKASGMRVFVRILIGIFFLIIISAVVVIPLLASSDAVFGTAVNAVYEWLKDFIFLSFWYRVLAFIGLSLLFASALFSWGRPFNVPEKQNTSNRLDPIITSIVLGGILILYLIFLGIQFNHLWVGELPFDFAKTEQLVKSGFWELLFLSVLNIVAYFFVYKKTIQQVQYILTAFTGASLLLLVSAGYRMGLYVTYYGFSYEKFFAFYAVLYCAILFVWLITKLFARSPADIIKFVAVLFLWMYAVVAVFPVEQFILRTNIALAERNDSRIRLFEMKMLSSDVLGTIKKYNQNGRLQENVAYLSNVGDQASVAELLDWNPWIEKQEKLIADKKWYEYNLMNVLE
jgi:hypothetical protein